MVVSILLISCQTEWGELVWIPYKINILLPSIWLSSYSLLIHISYFLFVWVIGHLYHNTKVAINKGKRETVEGIELSNHENIRMLRGNESYKYLGILEADMFQQTKILQNL